MKEYLTILENTESEFVINRSRFITSISHVTGIDEAKDFVADIKKKYNDATHNCYAFISDRLGLEMRFSDDKEPQGTAGQPILEVVKKRNLKEVAVVVTRYFGGIKLGVGGLISAYTESAASCIDKANVVRMVECDCFSLIVNYQLYSMIEIFLRDNCIDLKTEYNNDVTINFSIPEGDNKIIDSLKDLTSGQAKISFIKKEFAKW